MGLFHTVFIHQTSFFFLGGGGGGVNGNQNWLLTFFKLSSLRSAE